MDFSKIDRGDVAEIGKYTTHLIKCDRRPSAEVYKSVLSSFAYWLSKRDKTFDTFMITDIQEYFSNIPNNHTANQFLGALKGYMRFRCATIPFTDSNVIIETQRLNQMALVSNRPKRVNREKKSLTPDELKFLLETIHKGKRVDLANLIYSGVILHFYFGSRPIELGYWLRTSGVKYPAKIDWERNEMQLWTAKVNHYRFLSWAPGITPHLKRWCAAIPKFSTPNEWMTNHIGKYTVSGLHLTAYTGRRSVQTQMRLSGVDDFVTDAILGHVSRNSAVSDMYTDFEKFNAKIKEVMTRDHYMIKSGII